MRDSWPGVAAGGSVTKKAGSLSLKEGLETRLAHEAASVSKLLKSILSEISIILSDGNRLREHYGLQNDETGVAEAAELQSSKDARSKKLFSFLNKSTTDIKDQQRSMDALRRLRWSVRDKDSFMILIKDLRELNDGLYDLVPVQVQATLTQAVNAQLLSSTSNTTDVQVVKDAANPTYPVLMATAQLKMAGIRADELPVTLTSPLQLRLRATEIIFRKNDEPGSAIVLDENSSTRVFAEYRPYANEHSGSAPKLDVLVEWKPYDQHVQGTQAFVTSFRADGLARLLNLAPELAGLGTMQCIGYIDDSQHARFGFVFRLPAVGVFGSSIKPMTLNQIINLHPKLPPLEDSFALALRLTKTLYTFHCAKWLHKDFSSHNILLAAKASDRPHEYDLTTPFVAGFSYSSPEDHEGLSSEARNSSTNDFELYQHRLLLLPLDDPKPSCATAPRFCRMFDVYALGCVLLEIGLWRRLRDLWKPQYANEPEKWNHRLVNTWTNELRGRCGGTYETIVRACLTAEEGPLPADEPARLVDFCWDVIRGLEGLKV